MKSHAAAGLALTLTLAPQAYAAWPDEVTTALKTGEASVLLRYRYEVVDQDGVADTAHASTLKSRLSWTSGALYGVKALAEVDNVSAIGADAYNSGVNGHTNYPVVADPEATVINQAALSYKTDTVSATVGRQRIIQGDQRFIGAVAWRQLDQTFDGIHLTATPMTDLTLDYAWSWRVHTVFGPDSTQGHRDGDVHALYASYTVAPQQTVSAFGYLLDFDDFAALSSNTFGVEYRGTFQDALTLHAALATQSDAGDAPVDYQARYYQLEAGYTLSGVTITGGYEVLGSDGGTKAFATPLATLHKFQGFADKFLSTPANGVRDLYLGVNGKVGKFGYGVTWHDFSADHGGADYGQELDATASYPLLPWLAGLVKYAHYSADDLFTDTDKAWLMLTSTF